MNDSKLITSGNLIYYFYSYFVNYSFSLCRSINELYTYSIDITINYLNYHLIRHTCTLYYILDIYLIIYL